MKSHARLTRHAFSLVLVVSVAGCAMPTRAPVTGFLFTHVTVGDNVTGNTIEQRSVKGCASSLLGAFAWGNASVSGVAGSSGQVSVVDDDVLGVLGVYARHCTVVHAGTSEIALEDEPEEPAPVPPPKVKYYSDSPAPGGAPPGTVPPGTEQPGTTPPGTTQQGATDPKLSWGKTPPPDAPVLDTPSGWPGNVAIADRTACTLVCMENAVATESAQVEVVINKQLGAIRACGQHTSELHAVSSSVTFGPDGRMNMTVNMYGLKPSMRECIAHIPAPGYFKGPANTRWKCTDYCR